MSTCTFSMKNLEYSCPVKNGIIATKQAGVFTLSKWIALMQSCFFSMWGTHWVAFVVEHVIVFLTYLCCFFFFLFFQIILLQGSGILQAFVEETGTILPSLDLYWYYIKLTSGNELISCVSSGLVLIRWVNLCTSTSSWHVLMNGRDGRSSSESSWLITNPSLCPSY